jgi:type I restriction enzyme S subunit
MSLKTEFRVGVTERQVAFGQDCKAIIPAPGVDAKFLALALKARSRNILAMVDEAGHGTGRLPTDLIAKLKIDIPDLSEQRQITKILDSADDQIRLSMDSIAKQKELRIAAIRQLAANGLECFHGLEASELRRVSERSVGSWSLVPLGSLLTGIDAGHSPDLEDTPAGPGQWGVLKVSAVGEGGLRPEENKVVHYEGLHDPAICAHSGDLLVTRANTSQLVGRSCIVGDIPAGLMLSDKILRLRVAGQPTSTRYVHIVFGLAEVRRQIESVATGTSNSMKNISQSSVRQLIVPIGSREDINRIVEIDKLHEERITALRDEAEALRSLKHGLMDDLLTGRVRVAVLYLGVCHRGDGVGRSEDLLEAAVQFFWGAEGLAAGAHALDFCGATIGKVAVGQGGGGLWAEMHMLPRVFQQCQDEHRSVLEDLTPWPYNGVLA